MGSQGTSGREAVKRTSHRKGVPRCRREPGPMASWAALTRAAASECSLCLARASCGGKEGRWLKEVGGEREEEVEKTTSENERKEGKN